MNLIDDLKASKVFHELKDASRSSAKLARIPTDQIAKDFHESLEELRRLEQRVKERINQRLAKRS